MSFFLKNQVIKIIGNVASGKTTLAKKLAQKSKSILIYSPSTKKVKTIGKTAKELEKILNLL